MRRLSHGTAATATAVAENPPSNIVEFRPRPSSLALHWCAQLDGGQMPAEKRILARVVRRCRFATAADERRYKVAAGDIFTHEAHRTIAADIGRHRTTVWRALKPYQDAALIEVRQTRRRERVIVFRPPATAGATAGATAHTIHVREDPQRDPRRRSVPGSPRRQEGGLSRARGTARATDPLKVRHRDAPPTEKQMALYYLKAERLGLGAAFPPPTRGVMSDWLTAMDAAPAAEACKRVRRPNDPATARQWALLDALCREKHLAPPAAVSTREEVDRWIQEATSDRWRYAS